MIVGIFVFKLEIVPNDYQKLMSGFTIISLSNISGLKRV